MNMIKLALAATVLALSVNASAQMMNVVYIPDFPVSNSDTVMTEETAQQS